MKSSLILLLSILGSLLTTIASSQDKSTEAVMKPINDLFLAMKTNDSTLAASVFTKEAALFTITLNENGFSQIRESPVQRLISVFGQPKEQTWSEPIWNQQIEMTDGMASVWVDYAFYIDNTLSHCGIDAFQLIYTVNGWKIFHLADTRRKENCDIPVSISKQFKE